MRKLTASAMHLIADCSCLTLTDDLQTFRSTFLLTIQSEYSCKSQSKEILQSGPQETLTYYLSCSQVVLELLL